MIPPFQLIVLELVLLLVLLLPVGESLFWVSELILRIDLRYFTRLERVIVSFYAAGGLLYVLASLPISFFSRETLPLLVGTLSALGWLVTLGRVWFGSNGWRAFEFRAALRAFPSRHRIHIVLAVTGLALLLYEVWIWTANPFPNTIDGSVQTDFISVLFLNGSTATTLLPFAPMGVIYPQGTTVWFASAASMFDWPIVQTPVLLPPLFVSLSTVGAFCWGERMFGVETSRGRRAGITLAVASAVLLTWPRFLVAGSYDFLLSIPLLMVGLGLLASNGDSVPSRPRSLLLLGLGLGTLASLSPISAIFLICSWVGLVWARRGKSLGTRVVSSLRILSAGALSAAFCLPSLIGIVRWWSYPNHVLAPGGGGTITGLSTPPAQEVFLGLIDPLLFRVQDVWLSPFPILKIELASLLIIAIALAGFQAAGWLQSGRLSIPPQILGTFTVEAIVAGVLIGIPTFATGGFASLLTTAGLSAPLEFSIVLFMLYSSVATLPLILATEWLATELDPRLYAPSEVTSEGPRLVPRSLGAHRRLRADTQKLSLALAMACLIVPLGTGLAVTTIEAPTYIVSGIDAQLGNVTASDISALEWSESNLPDCSGILVAPGSAALFLPGYDPHLRLLYPMNPRTENLSYVNAVQDLTTGQFSNTTSSDLESLHVTEVFVTGQSNVLYKPFQSRVLESSPNFLPVFESGDAGIFEFLPMSDALECPAG